MTTATPLFFSFLPDACIIKREPRVDFVGDSQVVLIGHAIHVGLVLKGTNVIIEVELLVWLERRQVDRLQQNQPP